LFPTEHCKMLRSCQKTNVVGVSDLMGVRPRSARCWQLLAKTSSNTNSIEDPNTPLFILSTEQCS